MSTKEFKPFIIKVQTEAQAKELYARLNMACAMVSRHYESEHYPWETPIQSYRSDPDANSDLWIQLERKYKLSE